MSEKIEDGGPAFPSHGSMGEVVTVGLSLRDYFAGQALAGIMAKCSPEMGSHEGLRCLIEMAAQYSYAIADAMLKARSAEGRKEGR